MSGFESLTSAQLTSQSIESVAIQCSSFQLAFYSVIRQRREYVQCEIFRP